MTYTIFGELKNWRFDKKLCDFIQIHKILVEQLVE